MHRISVQRLLFAILLTLAVVALPTIVVAHHAWSDYHWARTANPFTVKMGNNVGGGWQTSFTNASSEWNSSSVVHNQIVAGGTKPRSCRPTSGRDEICSAAYGNTGWLGVAQIWLTTGDHIVQGTVKLNDTYFGTGSQYNTPSWRALVTCQEIGHTFGLDHQDTNFNNQNLGTCMDYTSNPDGPPSNTSPNQGDYDQLLCIYDPADAGRTLSSPNHSCTGTGHLDSFTTIGQVTKMPAAMTVVDYSEPNQWGRLVKGSREWGTSTYDLDFGHGNHIVTYVLWAK